MLRRGLVPCRRCRPQRFNSKAPSSPAAPVADDEHPPTAATALLLLPQRQASSSSLETIHPPAYVRRRGYHHMQPPPLHQRRTISSTMPRSRPADDNGMASSLVPPATWSIHDLQLLKEDVAAGSTHGREGEGLSQAELARLAGYAHVAVGEGGKLEQGQLQEDLGAIIRCMTLLQKADLGDVSREEMYAPPPHASSATPLREDVVTEGGTEQQRRLLALSGETARHLFVVPTVVDKA